MTDQWNPESVDRGWHRLRRRDNLEWRLAFCDRAGWRVSDVAGLCSICRLGRSDAFLHMAALCDGLTDQRHDRTIAARQFLLRKTSGHSTTWLRMYGAMASHLRPAEKNRAECRRNSATPIVRPMAK